MANERLYSAREAAKLLGVSELAIHRLLRQHSAPKVLGVYAMPMAFIERLKKLRGASSSAKASPKRGAA